MPPPDSRYGDDVDLTHSAAERALADELRAWLADAVPSLPPLPAHDDLRARRAHNGLWQKLLHQGGWAGLSWPVEYGGRGASPTDELIFLEECFRADAPAVDSNFVGLLHAGPTIMVEGTPEQKARWLPPILRGEEVWCQGFSEPGAGSDLAALATRAVRDGDEYVVTGQKIWSSYAHVADWCELLVRTDTDVPKHKGITWIAMRMDSPGLDIRPIETIMGSGEFCEVFLDEVRIPLANRVGAENDGWRVAMVTLSFERGTAFVGELLSARRLVHHIAELARLVPRAGGSAWDDAGIRRDLARTAAHLDACWSLTKWNVSEAARSGIPGVGGSVLKLQLAESNFDLVRVGMRVIDHARVALEDAEIAGAAEVVMESLRAFAVATGGGTLQIQRNIIAERILGLPKEPPWTSS